jgi:hypothetical protein
MQKVFPNMPLRWKGVALQVMNRALLSVTGWHQHKELNKSQIQNWGEQSSERICRLSIMVDNRVFLYHTRVKTLDTN